MSLFKEFIDVCFDGNQAKASEAIGLDPSTVSRILAGERSLTPKVARRIEVASKGRYRKERLVSWGGEPAKGRAA